MSASYTTVEFADESEFNLAPRYERGELEQRFNDLKDNLLSEHLLDTQSLTVEKRLKTAANEAASLAWTTEFPLLVFPALFSELARRERVNAGRQERITARTEMLLQSV